MKEDVKFIPTTYQDFEGFIDASEKQTKADFMYGEFDTKYPPYNLEVKSLEVVDSYGGEGQGETYYKVYQIDLLNGETFFVKFEGWYESNDGATFTSFYEVKPTQVTRTEYFRTK